MRRGGFVYFSKSDRYATIFIVVVAVALIVAFYGIGSTQTTAGAGDSIALPGDSRRAYDDGHRRGEGYYRRYDYGSRPNRKWVYDEQTATPHELFAFDPNTADSTQLLRLGLQPWTVRSIYRFRRKGGTFRVPSDLARVPSLSLRQYRELEPYIRIADDYQPASKHIPQEDIYGIDSIYHIEKLKVGENISLNSSDTSLLKRVPGIGSYFAGKIVEYRDKLGGYYDVRQLMEIDGFPKTALPYFNLEDKAIAKLRVNRLSLKQLDRHPYVNFYQARAITDYRRLKGKLHSMDDLRAVPDFSPVDMERLSHYFDFSE